MGISLEAIIGKRPKAKSRLMLTDDEIAELMQAQMNRENQLSVWIIAATCVRVSEFTNAQRQHVRTDKLTIKRLGTGLCAGIEDRRSHGHPADAAGGEVVPRTG